MTNLYIIVFVLAAVISAACFIRKEKKSGAACVGCPHSQSCGSHSACCSNEMKQTQLEG